MAALSSIEWTDRTWNPVRGCSVISPGCHNCYAMKQAHRFSGIIRRGEHEDRQGPYAGLTKQTSAGPQWTGVVRTVESALLEPLSWRKPARVFVNSMSDLFHEDVPDWFIARVFSVMGWAGWARGHTFQILTKRAQRLRVVMNDPAFRDQVREFVELLLEDEERPKVLDFDPNGRRLDDARANVPDIEGDDWPLKNVWLGASVENQKFANERIAELVNTPAAVRFLSCEPLLEHVDLMAQSHFFRNFIHWVIVGGESGNGARPFDLAWARSIVQQCKAAGVPVFFKQAGAFPLVPAGRQTHWDYRFVKRPEGEQFVEHDGEHWRMRLLDKKGGDIEELPEWARVREFPVTSGAQFVRGGA